MAEDGETAAATGGRTLWHGLLAAMLSDLLGPTGIEVRAEVQVAGGIPRADLVLIRREGPAWTEQQKIVLADGLRDLAVREILIEFKFRESLREEDLSRISSCDYPYLRSDQTRGRGDLQSVIVSARSVRKSFLKQFDFRPLTWPGVWESVPHWGGSIRLILLNQLGPEPHNALLKLFASRATERRRAFQSVEDAGLSGRSTALRHDILGLWRVLMGETMEEQKWPPMTHAELKAMGQEVVDFVGRTMTIEDLMRMPGPAAILRKHQEALAEQQAALEAERLAGRKVAQDAEARILRRLLIRKFNELPDWLEDKLSGAGTEDLEIWSERVLTAGSVDDVFQDCRRGED